MGIKDKIKTVIKMFQYSKNPIQSLLEYELTGKTTLITKYGSRVEIRKGKLIPINFIKLMNRGYKISSIGEDYLFERGSIKLVQPNAGVLGEKLEEDYLHEFPEKRVVLDIGGYLGETAVLFSKIGKAKKVLVFEPIPLHIEYIKKNIKLNNIKNIQVYDYAVTDKTGVTTIESETPDGCSDFGFHKGIHKIRVKTMSWKDVLKIAAKEGVYLAKVDCEGCEKYLTSIPCNSLRKIKIWIIETHNKEIEDKIIKKLEKCGFKHTVIREVETKPNLVKIHRFTID